MTPEEVRAAIWKFSYDIEKEFSQEGEEDNRRRLVFAGARLACSILRVRADREFGGVSKA